MENAEKELNSRGIKITQWKWLSTDFSGYEDTQNRSLLANAVVKEPAMSGRAKIFVAAFVAFVFLLPMLLVNLTGSDNLLISMLRCFVMLVAALVVWSRSTLFVVLGSAVSGLFAVGAVNSLARGSSTEGTIGLFTLAVAFAVGWYTAPVFRKNKIAVSDDQVVYGHQPSEWGRGAGDSTRSSIWVMGLLLNKLVMIPGVYVFHGLKSPGAKRIDVEHAVSHGNTVYLIDSWLDGSTHYNWHPNSRGTVISSKGDDGHRHAQIANAADRYRAALGAGVNIIPIISVTSGTASIGPERWSPRGVGLFMADEVLGFIGDGAVDSLPTWRDRPEVRQMLASSVVSYA
ncbi:hypothetical protein [Arthrobacter sp. OY3WO11]|uniref:hypothetical protein n=1 Tax=Arthrobacter sp. OY3WO11 TaxID=1835723 RepID=UPI0007CF5290|nr:hypothetical protein [Arthrobacter sp. OY3WO11]OAE00031.1 hypothetical protein A6A22_00185 [Arthrobacter sp. OY3WO11]